MHYTQLQSIILLVVLLLHQTGCESATFFSKWLLSSVGRRQNLGSLWQCPSLHPSMAYCSQPHSSHQAATAESVQEANVWIALFSSNCHPQAMAFVCTVYNPVCLHSHQVMPILPCREFCNEVYTACVSRMNLFGFKWPQQVDCNRFSSEKTSMCISSKLESVTCAPCNQEPTRENIIKRYCEADIVVKGQISGVRPFGNTSSLLVRVDRVSERLLPQPQIPTFGSAKPRQFFAHGVRTHGFMDTNDDLLNRGGRLKSAFPYAKSTTLESASPLSIYERANQPNNFQQPSTTVLSVPESIYSVIASETKTAGRGKPRQNGRNHSRFYKQRGRDRRSTSGRTPVPRDTWMSQDMLLDCPQCSLQLPASPMAPNSATRWLIMAKKWSRARLNSTSTFPRMQITSLMSWQKDALEFINVLRDIRNIPRAILCNPNPKVELDFDAFRRNEPSLIPYRPAISNSGDRQTWGSQNKSENYRWKHPTAGFEGLFQNDAAVNRQKKEQRQKNKRNTLSNQRPWQTSDDHSATPVTKERLSRRKARKEKLSRMNPEEKKAWLERRRWRKAQQNKAV